MWPNTIWPLDVVVFQGAFHAPRALNKTNQFPAAATASSLMPSDEVTPRLLRPADGALHVYALTPLSLTNSGF